MQKEFFALRELQPCGAAASSGGGFSGKMVGGRGKQ
jgi:hypothetical protein